VLLDARDGVVNTIGLSNRHWRGLERQRRINEGITEVRLVTSQEFENMLRNAEITDSFSVACYLHARLRGLL
jgi:hypothetical protein